MKKLATFVFAMLLTASLSFAQAGTDTNKSAGDKTASTDSGKKAKGGKKAKKSKKSKKGSTDSSAPSSK